MEQIHSYKDLTIWRKGIDLVISIYDLTKGFPKDEIFGLTSQIKRAAVSLPTNIAEGRFRGTRKDFIHFLQIAYSSGAELETELLIAEKLGFGNTIKLQNARMLLEEMKMLNTMLRKLRS
jgi:four helix bundle protein